MLTDYTKDLLAERDRLQAQMRHVTEQRDDLALVVMLLTGIIRLQRTQYTSRFPRAFETCYGVS